MQVETTALLIDADALPSTLEEQLAKRDVMSEFALISEIGQMLAVVAPDLVVLSSSSDVEAALSEVRLSDEKPPVVVLADRAALRELREKGHPEVSALIPSDLPVAAMAHRLAAMSQKSAAGKPLSLRKQTTRPKAAAKTAAPAPAPRTRTVLGLGHPAQPLSPVVPPFAFQEIKIFEHEDDEIIEKISDQEANRRRLAEEREKQRLEAGRTEQVAKEQAATKERARNQALSRMNAGGEAAEQKTAEQKATEQKATEQKATEQKAAEQKAAEQLAEQKAAAQKAAAQRAAEQKAAAQKATAQRAAEQKAAEQKAAEQKAAERKAATQVAEQKAAAQKAAAQRAEEEKATSPKVSPKRTSNLPPPAKPKGPGGDEELSVIMPLPVNLRLPLGETEALPEIRLALLDTDLTRADAIAAALREKGMVLRPVTPDVETTRWPLLRRFAPQGLLVDEKSLARGAAEWVETFRGDLFLRHVPLIVYRFSQLFRESTGDVTLGGLLPLVDHLGREESVLLDKLRPGRQVDLLPSQIPPFRLVQMLTGEDRNTRLDCRSGTERVVWHLGPGYAGTAKLVNAETDRGLARLSAEEAFLWLLKHEDCSISVHEHTEPLAHASQSVDSTRLLRELTEAMGTPSRHQSVRPGAQPFTPGPPSESSQALLMQEPSPVEESPEPPNTPGRPSSDEPVEVSGSGHASRFLLGLRPHVLRAKDTVVSATKGAVSAYQSFAERALAPLEGKVPDWALRAAPLALPFLLASALLIVLVSGGENTGSENKGAEEAGRSAPPAQAAKPAAGAPPPEAGMKKESPPKPEEASPKNEAPETGKSLWQVASDAALPSCEKKLQGSAPTSENAIKSAGYWKNARQLLMVGKSAEAFENMCLAGLYDPSGPAAEGLSEYYLGQRSLKEAERWARASLSADSSRRKSRELLGDIESQKGNQEEAKRIWLETMGLRGDETRKLTATARKFVQDARLAKRSGDLPRAERTIRRAAALSPDDATIALEFADILLRRSATEAAGRWADQALKLDPDLSPAKLLAGRIQEALGKKDLARAHYESVPLGDPFHSQAQNRRSQL